MLELQTTRRIEWDDRSVKDIDRAKSRYSEAKLAGKKITDLQGNPVTTFRPSLQAILISEQDPVEGELRFHILDETGDRTISWNMKDPFQIKDAAEKFNKFIEQGCKCYVVDKHGNKSHRIFGFDPEAQELIFEEKTLRQSLKEFSKKFSEIKVLPKTTPG